jgi:menaquinone-dependent protoporphyrinogen oxidase
VEVVVMHVLVAYAGISGSTGGVACRIADGFHVRGLMATCLRVTDIGAVRRYDAVVVGSGVYDRAWLPEAVDFVTARVPSLADKPLWLFSVGAPGALAHPLDHWVVQDAGAVAAPFAGIVRPLGTRVFAGVVREEQLSARSRMTYRLHGGHYGDHRDWDAIGAWADDIADSLKAPIPVPRGRIAAVPSHRA